ncbi:hypothetical protein ACH5RR_013995 [Cinchona calisaya]|uniref:J domain-containing protein n=1 Tax=Cinchona calisaya TaxID=153742 RepID=A0ABD3A345_9GENT
MAIFIGYTAINELYRYRRPIHSVCSYNFFRIYVYPAVTGHRWLSTSTESTPSEFRGPNAYDLLGVSETSSLAEIKASFHKLAKETHPDLSESHADSSANRRFVQILAAYEILSDCEKRAHYNQYLLSQRVPVQRLCRQGSEIFTYDSHRIPAGRMEVVEWLKWYRYAVNQILLEKRVVVGSGYFDVLERDFYSAIHAAYYGPEIECLDLLPDCFEAEVRSQHGTPEVLHLVSGRDLFGMVRVANPIPEISHAKRAKLTSFASALSESIGYAADVGNSCVVDGGIYQNQETESCCSTSDAYKNLELCIAGRLVAVARRVPPKSLKGKQNKEDSIHVYLTPHDESVAVSHGFGEDNDVGFSLGYRTPLGTITGLGTSPEEGSCYVYDKSGVNTHVIMKHRTLLVKHMHWYQVGDKASVCECRCTRAQLPPSKFWLFEPRCSTHDIGGWYVETFGRDKKARSVLSQRYWDALDANELFDKRLHPAMYLLALAYRSLDIEDARIRKKTMKDIVETKLYRILNWCKKLA